MTPIDVLVVGGGPSGLAAASAAAEQGGSVMLVDEWPELGGRLRYRRTDVGLGPLIDRTVPADRLRTALVRWAAGAGVDLRPSTVAWAAFVGSRGIEVGLRRDDREAEIVTPAKVILATGTTDRAAVVPGATLPGVLTARALQILLNCHGVRPGRRFGLLGEDRADELRGDIEAAGGVVARVVAASALGSVIIHGEEGVVGLSVGEERIDLDIVVTALGTLPDTQIAGMIGCDVASDGSWPPRPRRAEDGALSLPGVFTCGTSAGAGAIGAAILDGFRVGRGGADDEAEQAVISLLLDEGSHA